MRLALAYTTLLAFTCATASACAEPEGQHVNTKRFVNFAWLTDGIAGVAASTALSLRMHGLVHAKINTNSPVALWKGDINSVAINAHGGRFRGVPLGNLQMRSTGPFKLRYFVKRKATPRVMTPLVVSVSGDISQGLCSRALRSPEVTDQLRFLKFDLPGLGEQRLQILKPRVDLIGNKVAIESYLLTQNAEPDSGIKLRIIARPELDQQRFIRLHDMRVESDEVSNPGQFGFFAQQLFNPLVDFGRYDRKTHAFRMDKLDISDRVVRYSGRLLIVPKQP